MIDYMRDATEEYRLGIRTFWEINDFLGELAARTARDRKMYQLHKGNHRKKPTRAAIVSALLLKFQDLPVTEQNDWIREGMAKFNALTENAPKLDDEVEPQAQAEPPTKMPPVKLPPRPKTGSDRKSG